MDRDDPWFPIYQELILDGIDPEEIRDRAAANQVSPELIAEALRRPLEIWEGLASDELPPFEQWEALPPGVLDLRVFDQDTWWCDILRTPHRLTEMSDEYLANVMALLQDRSESFYEGYSAIHPEALGADSAAWLEATALMIGLRAELGTRGGQLE